MKKVKFYTAIYNREKGTHAELKNGWTDGNYNYYCTKYGNHTSWCAIVPALGLKVGSGANTLKATAAEVNTPEMLSLVKERVSQMQKEIEIFSNMITKAQEEEKIA